MNSHPIVKFLWLGYLHMAKLLFWLRTAHGVMSSQPELPKSEGLTGMEDLPPGWVIYIHRLHSVLGRWLQGLTFSLVLWARHWLPLELSEPWDSSEKEVVFQHCTPFQCSGEARVLEGQEYQKIGAAAASLQSTTSGISFPGWQIDKRAASSVTAGSWSLAPYLWSSAKLTALQIIAVS